MLLALLSPLVLTIGGGARENWHSTEFETFRDAGPALELAIGYRFHRAPEGVEISAVVRGAVAAMTTERLAHASMGLYHYDVNRRWPVDVAAGVQIESGRWWLLPWAGVELRRARQDYRLTHFEEELEMTEGEVSWEQSVALGLTMGVNLYRDAAVFVGLQDTLDDYSAVTIGIAYRR